MTENSNLSPVALVTGAARGQGRSHARRLAADAHAECGGPGEVAHQLRQDRPTVGLVHLFRRLTDPQVQVSLGRQASGLGLQTMLDFNVAVTLDGEPLFIVGSSPALNTWISTDPDVMPRITDDGLSGKEAAKLLDRLGITLNFNTIPFDPRPPFRASGLRVGTPAMTTQGMKEDQAAEVASLICRALKQRSDEAALSEISSRIADLAAEFPPYPHDFAGHV